MIHLIVGNTGSGKTTYATELRKQTNGVIFSIDKWNNTLFLADKTPEDGLDWMLERINRSELMIMDLVAQLEASGIDSILDLGFSKFKHRETFRAFARSIRAEAKIHFLDIPSDVRLQRVVSRNKEKGETFEFEVTEQDFHFMEHWFERPDPKEMLGGEVISGLPGK
jgi:predicted kinase